MEKSNVYFSEYLSLKDRKRIYREINKSEDKGVVNLTITEHRNHTPNNKNRIYYPDIFVVKLNYLIICKVHFIEIAQEILDEVARTIKNYDGNILIK